MNVLIWSPNYAPEPTGIPPLVTDAAEWLAERGHAVQVVTPFPNYPHRVVDPAYRGRFWVSETRGKVVVHRSWLRVRPAERFADKALYEITTSLVPLPRVIKRIAWADVLVCVVPTLLSAYFASLAAPRTRVVLWVQDLVASAAASVSHFGRLAQAPIVAAERLERSAAARADRVVVCSPGFADHFVRAGIPTSKIDVVYNWANLDRIRAVPPRLEGEVSFLYAGNVGYTQGLETLVDAAALLRIPAQVEIVGTGNSHAEIVGRAKGMSNVTVGPPVAADEFPALLQRHHAHLVMQRSASAGANFPSKIATYLASGRPVIGSIAASTPAADVLRRSGGALLVSPESPRLLAAAMDEVAASPDLREELGRKGRAFAEQHFDRAPALQALEQALLAPHQGRGAERI